MKMDVKLIVTIFVISSTYKLASTQQIEPIRQDQSGYSTNIVHHNSHYPDEQPESTVNIHFDSTNLREFDDEDASTYKNLYSENIDNGNSQDYPLQAANNADLYKLQNNHNTPSSQSFNVGYSVKFAGSPTRQMKQQIFLNPDIITGSHKEEVIKPQSTGSEEYILNSVLDSKKQKISGIKTKHHGPVISNIDPAKLLAQANLSPKTQMKLSELQGNIQPNYQTDQYIRNANNSPWKSLGPGVEIYQSSSLNPVTTVSNDFVGDSKRFDHAKALGKSIGFDYSNAVGFKPLDLQYSNTKTDAETAVYQNSDTVKKPLDFQVNPRFIPIGAGDIKFPSFNDNPAVLSIGSSARTTDKGTQISFQNTPQFIQTKTEDIKAPSLRNFGEKNLRIQEEKSQVIPVITEASTSLNVYSKVADIYTPLRLNTDLLETNKHTNKSPGLNYYFGNYESSVKNSRDHQPITNSKFNTAQAAYSNLRQTNTQSVENAYKLSDQNTSPTFDPYGKQQNNLKNFYGQYDFHVPVIDFTKNSVVQQYLSQPSNAAQKSGSVRMYSVKENQPDDVNPNQLYKNRKTYGKNFYNFYVPYNNFYRHQHGDAKINGLSSRFVKDTKMQLRPSSRNKGLARVKFAY